MAHPIRLMHPRVHASKLFFFLQSWQGKGPFFLAVRVSGCDVLAFRFVPPFDFAMGARCASLAVPIIAMHTNECLSFAMALLARERFTAV